MHKMEEVITHNDKEWRVIGVGATNPENGTTYYHLASTTDFIGQRNGRRPKMCGVWI